VTRWRIPTHRTFLALGLGVVKTVAFDLDGVVADTMGRYEELAVHVFSPYLREPFSRELYRQTCGRTFREQVELIFGGLADRDSMVGEFEAGRAAVYEKSPPFVEALATMMTLKMMKYRVAIVSSTQRKQVDEWIFRNELDEVVDVIEGWAPGREKDIQVRAVGASVLVGDSDHDREFAERAGVDFFFVEDGSELGGRTTAQLVRRLS